MVKLQYSYYFDIPLTIVLYKTTTMYFQNFSRQYIDVLICVPIYRYSKICIDISLFKNVY